MANPELHDDETDVRKAMSEADGRFQPEPPLAGARATMPLTDVQDCVLALIELDPRLVYGSRREVLRLLAGLFHARFTDRHRVGRALRRLREHHEAGLVVTRAFGERPRDALTGEAPPWSDPDAATSRKVIGALLRRYGGRDPNTDAMESALRWLGVPVVVWDAALSSAGVGGPTPGPR